MGVLIKTIDCIYGLNSSDFTLPDSFRVNADDLLTEKRPNAGKAGQTTSFLDLVDQERGVAFRVFSVTLADLEACYKQLFSTGNQVMDFRQAQLENRYKLPSHTP